MKVNGLVISRGSKEDSLQNTLNKGDPMGGSCHTVISYVVAPKDTVWAFFIV